ncbi:hypothetical protein VUR80DRAFT_7577 [Thermomyces stellatus]
MATPVQNDAAAPVPAQAPQPSEPAAAPADGKTVQCLVLDTGALIKNEPSVSTLLAQAHELFTIPAVLSEIRDAATRARVDTTLRPFMTIRSPKPESIRFITAFARRTGDLEVLSAPDIHLLALTYELECERNGGDWRLRNTPGQKHLNGSPPSSEERTDEASEQKNEEPTVEAVAEEARELVDKVSLGDDDKNAPSANPPSEESKAVEDTSETQEDPSQTHAVDDTPRAQEEPNQESDGDSDESDGWITPSNLKKHVEKDQRTSSAAQPATEFLQAALLTTDYAMQNVALRINLHLLSPSMYRITRLRTYCLRCHGCFAITKDMTRQFCHKCGQPTLIRTSCSVENGVFQVHLRKNFQYNKRGNVYSIPKPTGGTSSGKTAKLQGGGKGGWGNSLVLAEDQKEYVRAKAEKQRARQRDLMDEDYLPGLVTGERKSQGERIRVGAGRGVNATKRRH